MSDYIEYTPKRHGQRPPYWTPDTLTGLDNKRFVRQPNWAWIAGTVYYVPYEAVHGVPRPAPVDADADAEPVDICPNCEMQANTIEELRAANERWAIAFKQVAAEERAKIVAWVESLWPFPHHFCIPAKHIAMGIDAGFYEPFTRSSDT